MKWFYKSTGSQEDTSTKASHVQSLVLWRSNAVSQVTLRVNHPLKSMQTSRHFLFMTSCPNVNVVLCPISWRPCPSPCVNTTHVETSVTFYSMTSICMTFLRKWNVELQWNQGREANFEQFDSWQPCSGQLPSFVSPVLEIPLTLNYVQLRVPSVSNPDPSRSFWTCSYLPHGCMP